MKTVSKNLHKSPNEQLSKPVTTSEPIKSTTDNPAADPQKTEEHHERKATLNTLDRSFIGIPHRRKTGRMLGHEPGPDTLL